MKRQWRLGRIVLAVMLVGIAALFSFWSLPLFAQDARTDEKKQGLLYVRLVTGADGAWLESVINTKPFQEELKLTNKQLNELRVAISKITNMSNRTYVMAIKKHLSPDQEKRFMQIVRQIEGPASLLDHPIDGMEPLSDAQKKAISAISQECNDKKAKIWADIFSGRSRDYADVFTTIEKTITDQDDKIAAVLKSPQKDLWLKSIGSRFYP